MRFITTPVYKNLVMKDLMLYMSILLGTCVLNSCSNSGNSTGIQQLDDVYQINIPLKIKDTFLSPDSLFCMKEILPLETTSECLISDIDKLEIADDKLYILDDSQDMIFIFDRKGKYLNRIADIGRGPNEYYELSDFHIDDNLIYITAGSSNNKIMCYDLNGNFTNSFDTEKPAQRITTDSNYIYVYYNFSYRNGCNVGVYDKKENRLIKRYKPYPPQQEGMGYDYRCWVSCNNKVYASFPYEYNIYELFPDTCRVVATINYGEKYMFPKAWNNYSPLQRQNYIKEKGGTLDSHLVGECNSLFVSPQRTIFTFTHNRHGNITVINNATKSVQFGVLEPTEYYWNVYGLDPVYVSDQYAVGYSTASSIIASIEMTGKIPEKTLEWNLGITEDDNPCLYFYKFKD